MAFLAYPNGAFQTASEPVSSEFKVTTHDFVAFQASHIRSDPRQFTNAEHPAVCGITSCCATLSVREGGVGVLDVHRSGSSLE